MKRGFTIIELIIYVALMALVVVALIQFILHISNSRNQAAIVTEVQANIRTSLNFIAQKIRVSNGVNVGASVFGSDPGVLSLSMSDPNQNPTVIRLDEDDGRMIVTEGSSDPVYVTTNDVEITSLVFKNFTGRGNFENIGVDLDIRYRIPEGSGVSFEYEKEVRTSVSLRQ